MGIMACEQSDRPTSYNKGTYGGTADQKLNADTVRELQNRSDYQGSTY